VASLILSCISGSTQGLLLGHCLWLCWGYCPCGVWRPYNPLPSDTVRTRVSGHRSNLSSLCRALVQGWPVKDIGLSGCQLTGMECQCMDLTRCWKWWCWYCIKCTV